MSLDCTASCGDTGVSLPLSLRNPLARHLLLTGAEITFADGYPPMAPTDGNRALLAIHNQASLDVGGGAVAAVDPSQAKRAALVIVRLSAKGAAVRP